LIFHLSHRSLLDIILLSTTSFFTGPTEQPDLDMYLTSVLHSLIALAAVSSALPAIPRSPNAAAGAGDGFPSPSPEQLTTIQQEAGGQLSNAPPPPKLAPSSLTAFQLIAFNENFEVAFFSSLIDNVTNNAPGFELADKKSKDELLSILVAVKAVCPLSTPPCLIDHEC
jgi:hypothetical protein